MYVHFMHDMSFEKLNKYINCYLFLYNRLELGECKPNLISSNCEETNALSCEQNPSWTPKRFENRYSKYKIPR